MPNYDQLSTEELKLPKKERDELIRRRKAEALRYKKPLVQEIGLDEIRYKLAEMGETCADVRWFLGDDEDALEDILGEDDAFEFQGSFTALSADIERMQGQLEDMWLPDYYDDFLAACRPEGKDIFGFDEYEEDFFPLDRWETEAACRDAKKRMEKKTKSELIDCCHTVLGVIVQYMAIKYRYDCLEATYRVLMDRTQSSLQGIKRIEELYEEAAKSGFREWDDATRRLDQAVRDLPERMWIE